MGQGNSTNGKQAVEKSDSAEQVEQAVSNEDSDTTSKSGSLKKNKWLPRKQSEDKPKKPKKNEKKKKKKGEEEEVSSATMISDADRTSLRHSRIELHLEECQPAPDEDDAISLSSCGEDPRKNLEDFENEEPPSLLICDYSSNELTASPGESLSSGQDSGFARGNTIRSVSSEDENTITNIKNKEIASEINTELITPPVEVTEKCKDYIENSCSPMSSPENSVVEEQTVTITDDSLAESTGDTISPSTVPVPTLETQTSLTETPEIASQTEETPVVEVPTTNTDENLAESDLKEETICDTISSVTAASPKLETQTSLTETPEIISQTEESSVVEDETKNTEDESLADSDLKPEENCDASTVVPCPQLETQTSLTETPVVESQTEEVIKESDLVTGMVKELVNETLESAVQYLTHEYKNLTNKSEVIEVEQRETVDKDLEVTEVTEVIKVTEVIEVTDEVSGEGLDNKDSVDVEIVEVIEKKAGFEELSYALEVKPNRPLESLTEEPEDKSDKSEAIELDGLLNGDSTAPNDSLLSTESEDNSTDLAEIIQKEEVTVCPSEVLISTDLDADDSGINDSGEIFPPIPCDLSLAPMIENSQSLEELSPPEIISDNEFQNNGTDSSSGSAPSPPPTKESKETAERSPSSSTTQPIPDSTTGAVFV